MFWAGKRVPRKLWKTRLRRNWRMQVTGAELPPAGFSSWAILNVQKHNGSGCCCAGIIAWHRYRPHSHLKSWISAKWRKLQMPRWGEWGLPARQTLREIVTEIACCHPSTSVLLRNKWLPPRRIFWGRLPTNTNEEYRTCPSFRSEKVAESWLNELFLLWWFRYTVLPLDNQNRLNPLFCKLLLNRSGFGGLF